MKIESVSSEGAILTVQCSGVFRVSSESMSPGNLITGAINRWMIENPNKQLEEIVLDFTLVDYVWGDGVLWSLLQFKKRGVSKFRLLSSPKNHKTLEGHNALAGGWFHVERKAQHSFLKAPIFAVS